MYFNPILPLSLKRKTAIKFSKINFYSIIKKKRKTADKNFRKQKKKTKEKKTPVSNEIQRNSNMSDVYSADFAPANVCNRNIRLATVYSFIRNIRLAI